MSVLTARPGPLLVSFRDANEPRALAARLIAVAHQHARGWSVSIPGSRETEHVTFEAAACTVIRSTGITRLLIVWSAETDA
jgi:hypothetical protein